MMKHIGTKPLETERLTLRRFTLEDAEAMYRNWASDPEVTKYLTWQPHESVEGTAEILQRWLEDYEKEDNYLWAIVPREKGEPVGAISVVGQDNNIQMVHIGYCLGKEWWHQGIMSESMTEVVKFFFREVGVNRVESRHSILNPNSGAVMKKCGLLYEGTKRQGDCCTNGISDSVEYAILAEDYFR